MNDEVEPIVGNWYRREDDDEVFLVVSIDEEEGVIEIRPLDGEVEEIETDVWEEMSVELIDEPEEWDAELDEAEDDDGDYDDEDEDEEDEDDEDDWGDEFADRE